MDNILRLTETPIIACDEKAVEGCQDLIKIGFLGRLDLTDFTIKDVFLVENQIK